MLNKAINGKYPEGTAILNIGFENYKKLQKTYKHAEERLDEILRELDELI